MLPACFTAFRERQDGKAQKGEEPGGQPSRLSWPSSLASDAYVRKVSFWSQVSPELGPCNWTEREQVGQVPGQTCESSPLPLAQQGRSEVAWIEL